MLPIMKQIIIKPKINNPKVFALADRLRVGKNPACLLIQGDSTCGTVTTGWFWQVIAWLSAKYPAYTFLYKEWNDTHQNYSGDANGNPNTLIRYGSSGDAYATIPNAAGSYITCPDSAELSITGDLDLRVKVAVTNPGSGGALAAKWSGTGGSSYMLLVTASAGLQFYWTPDGSTALNFISTDTNAGLTNGSDIWARVTLDVDNGASGHDVKFYTSTDGVSWTQLGSTRTGAGTTGINISAGSVVALGARSDGAQNRWTGRVYEAEIRAGINGKIVASPNLDQAFPSGVTTFKDTEGNTFTVNGTVTVGNGSPGVMVLNGVYPGGAISYSTDVTRFALQTPIEPQLSFINYGHNNNDPTGFQTAYDGLCTQILTKYPNAGIIGVTQNPQISPRTAEQVANHLSTQQQAIAVLQAKGYGLVDAYKVMNSSPTTYTSGSDGVHPIAAGCQIWAQTVEKYLQQTGRI